MQEAGLAAPPHQTCFLIYKVGKIIPTVATSQVITDIKAGLMIVKIEANVSSFYDDTLVSSKHIPAPRGNAKSL